MFTWESPQFTAQQQRSSQSEASRLARESMTDVLEFFDFESSTDNELLIRLRLNTNWNILANHYLLVKKTANLRRLKKATDILR